MLTCAQKFRVADLSTVGTSYLQDFLATKIEEKSPGKMAKSAVKPQVRVPVRRSPTGELFKQTSSQGQGSDSVSSAKAAAETSAEPALTEEQTEALMKDPIADMV